MRMRNEDGHKAMLAAGEAWGRIKNSGKRSWADYTLVIGPGLMQARVEAMAIAGTNQPMGHGYDTTISELLREYKLDDMRETTRAHTLKIMENLATVEEWRAKQLQDRRADGRETVGFLNNVTDVWLAYQRSAKPQQDQRDRTRRPNDAQQTNQELAAARQRVGEFKVRTQAARRNSADAATSAELRKLEAEIAELRKRNAALEVKESAPGSADLVTLIQRAADAARRVDSWPASVSATARTRLSKALNAISLEITAETEAKAGARNAGGLYTPR